MNTPAPRECGRCTACCTALAIRELNKVPGIPCVHLRLGKPGCNRYATRPPSCTTFRCAWLNGWGDDTHRPDKSGVVFSDQQVEDGRPYVGAFEIVEAAAHGSWAAGIVQQAVDAHIPVVIFHPGANGRATLVPPTGDTRPLSEILAETKIKGETVDSASVAPDVSIQRSPK